MRAILQRVSRASVSIDGQTVGAIQSGLLLLLGIESADSESDIDWLIRKITQMRIFPDSDGKMNLSVQDIEGDILVVSQFTLHASTKKGNRPGFGNSAPPTISKPLYEQFKDKLRTVLGKDIPCGRFGADMQVELINDGPVTIILDSKRPE